MVSGRYLLSDVVDLWLRDISCISLSHNRDVC